MYGKICLQKKRGWRNLLKMGLGLAVFAMISLIIPYLEAKTFPDRPVHLIVPYPAGSASDVAARVISPGMEKSLGVRVIIENIPGADSRIGLTKLLKAKPDGYPIGLAGFHLPILHEYLFDVPFDNGGLNRRAEGNAFHRIDTTLNLFTDIILHELLNNRHTGRSSHHKDLMDVLR